MTTMSLEDKVNDDDDYHSFSSSTNSDDNISEFDCSTHRSCSRYASCNRTKHQNSSNDSLISMSLPKNSKPNKGDIRSIDNQPEHRQKFDGARWRRICCISHCSTFLNGGIFFANWLCRKHYLLNMKNDVSNKYDDTTKENKRTTKSTIEILPRASTRQSNKKADDHKRGDIMVNTDGIRQKYDGRSWRSVCSHNDCKSFMIIRGYCHRHDVENRKKHSEVLFSLNDTQQQNPIPKSQKTRSTISIKKKPRKGEIRLIRQEWNGTKWYSLCHHHSRKCKQRSAGVKSAYLCDKHFEEYKNGEKHQNFMEIKDEILLSPTIKRKKSINNNDSMYLSNMMNESNGTVSCLSKSSFNRTQPVEQCIQTDVTYPIDSDDLRQGCFFVEDDNNEQSQSDSPQLLVYIKKEEEDYLVNRRKLAIDINSFSSNCKLELTKLET